MSRHAVLVLVVVVVVVVAQVKAQKKEKVKKGQVILFLHVVQSCLWWAFCFASGAVRSSSLLGWCLCMLAYSSMRASDPPSLGRMSR